MNENSESPILEWLAALVVLLVVTVWRAEPK